VDSKCWAGSNGGIAAGKRSVWRTANARGARPSQVWTVCEGVGRNGGESRASGVVRLAANQGGAERGEASGAGSEELVAGCSHEKSKGSPRDGTSRVCVRGGGWKSFEEAGSRSTRGSGWERASFCSAGMGQMGKAREFKVAILM
jgi:hypothetical protein